MGNLWDSNDSHRCEILRTIWPNTYAYSDCNRYTHRHTDSYAYNDSYADSQAERNTKDTAYAAAAPVA